ncbi:MAG: hypothetical protein K8Q91_02560 [Candidatus Vogelbacteria bacterium]|nr:hypothetical protein [Candidatus Vogelbacteria bacterium]
MPVAFVTRDPSKISDGLLLLLRQKLPVIIAQHLSVPEGALTPEDIELRFMDIGRFDVVKRPLEILIFANDYPTRRESLEKRSQAITDDVSEMAPGRLTNFWVWILLGQGGFSKLEK